ncbi:MAG: IPT/TIG domain-containing protein, partial [Thermaerobacter sp.]|nr:IPT/TIG domain-containing protein [Thermaerobacter sp.]
VYSVSYGAGEQIVASSEPNAQATWDLLAEEANAEGITVSVSAGDSGGFEGAQFGLTSPMPSYPANSPYVSSLGGTEDAVSPAGTVQQVAMWGGNIGSELSTPTLLSFLELQNMIAGGGYSSLEPAPSYQVPVIGSATGRGNPDFSLPASVITPGYFFFYDGLPGLVGGTSASAPLFAGFVADLDAALHTAMGNINPAIYHADQANSGVMSTVAYGNNGAYSVTPGYNAVTGLGQLNMGVLYAMLTGVQTTPVIQGVTPNSAASGANIYITGQGFGSARGTVAIDKVPATIKQWTPNSIEVTVPNSVSSGSAPITVMAADGLTSTWTSFTVQAPQKPTISGLYPSTAPVGATLYLYGENFGSTPGTVTIGGKTATVQNWSPYYLTVTVPSTLKSGPATIVVTAADGQTGTSTAFTVQAPPTPTISGLYPSTAPVGATVSLYGSNFGSTPGTVTIGGKAATVQNWSPYYLTVTVPSGLNPGKATITVTAADGQTGTSTAFAVQAPPTPVISGLYPNTAPVGATVSLYGSNFGSTPGTVTIGGKAATVQSWSPYYLTVTVPSTLKSGPATIVVTAADGQTGTSTAFTVQAPPTPTISGLYPSTAPVGATVSLYGSNFGSTPGTVTIGGKAATVQSWSPYYLTVTVPSGLNPGKATIAVTAADGQTGTSQAFTVQAPPTPTIAGLYPNSAAPGATLYLYGSNFGATAGTVTIGGQSAKILQWSNYYVAVQVPTLQPGSATIALKTAGGQSAQWTMFTVLALT